MSSEVKRKRMSKRAKEEILRIYIKNPVASAREVRDELRRRLGILHPSQAGFSISSVRYFLKKVMDVYPPSITAPYGNVLLLFSQGLNGGDLLSRAENFLVEEFFGGLVDRKLKPTELRELKSHFILHSSFPGSRILSLLLVPRFILVDPEELLGQINSWDLIDGGVVLDVEEEMINVSQEFYDVTRTKRKSEKEKSDEDISLLLFLIRLQVMKQFLTYKKEGKEDEVKELRKYSLQQGLDPSAFHYRPRKPASPIISPVEYETSLEELSQKERATMFSSFIHKEHKKIDMSLLKGLVERKVLGIIPKMISGEEVPQMNSMIVVTIREENPVKDLLFRLPYSHNFNIRVTRSFGDVGFKRVKKLFLSISKVFSSHLSLLLESLAGELPQTFLIRVVA